MSNRANLVIADEVKGVDVTFDSKVSFFHVDFDIGSGSRAMWIPASALMQVRLLPPNWRSADGIVKQPFGGISLSEDPVVVSFEYQPATNGWCVLHPKLHNGKAVGLSFSPQAWEALRSALTK
jgi:hypothetical protein